MADVMENLLKSENSAKEVPAKPSKKLNETKKRLNGICKSIMIDSSIYSPKKTVDSIDAYIKESSKVDRILYSEISSFIVALDESGRGTFSTNIEKLLMYVLDEANSVQEDSRKICIKIYDHFQLNLTQIESSATITQMQIAKTIGEEKASLHREVKEVEKEYITILGIFAAIMLAFVGSFTFSTSVLNNVTNTNAYKLAIISLVIGLVFIILITILIEFLKEINDKVHIGEDGKRKMNSVSKMAIILIFILIVVTILGNSISQIKFPEKVYLNSQKETIDNTKVENDISSEY
ncbi:hypothetical protein [Enterocloster clostridioformis]|uniref:hypothetical protein n=1 Tax=Enterocloster clostridioformis TaxID=1531 RepID=UPI00321A8AB7